MSLAFRIARRISLGNHRSFSAFITRIAIAAVALSMVVMVVTTASVNGFKYEISRKIFGFWGHIHINTYDLNYSYEDIQPISVKQSFYPNLDTLPGVHHIQVYANIAGIIKTPDNIEGIMLKGIGSDFDWTFLRSFLIQGDTLNLADSTKSNSILISQKTAKRLMLKTGDGMVVYFVKDRPKVRKFTVAGIYKTGLEEYDEKYALVDIRHIQKINGWEDDQVGGFEVILDNVNDIDTMTNLLNDEIIGADTPLQVQSMKDIDPNIFEWLELQNTNEQIILVLMIFVAIINMAAALLILILERTNMIGILKALGATNRIVQQIFLYNAAIIMGVGLFIGNVIGLGVCYLQQHYGIIKLSEEQYYLSVAPMKINWPVLIGLNAGSLIVCVLVMLLPSLMVVAIQPIKAIRFK